MEHILNRRTATILTYINQGRRPAAPSPFSLPARPAVGPVRGPPRDSPCPPGPVVMAPPIPPHTEGPRPRSSNPDPPGPAIGTRFNGCERIRGGKGGGKGRNGWMSEWIRTGGIRVNEDEWGGEDARVPYRGGKTRNPPGARGGSTGGNRIV